MINLSIAIQAIQKIDRNSLPHAEKQILINLTILKSIGNNSPDNTLLGTNIGENKDYAKNLIARLKKKEFIDSFGKGKNRKIDILWTKIFGNSQLPDNLFGNPELPNQTIESNSQLPNKAKGNSQLPNDASEKVTPIIYKRRYKERRNVVVSLAEKYKYVPDEKLIESLIDDTEKELISLFEYTKSKKPDNPNGFMFSAKKNNWTIPEYKDPYEEDKKQLAALRAEALKAKELGFKSAGYSN